MDNGEILDIPNSVILKELKKQGKQLETVFTILTSVLSFGLGYGIVTLIFKFI
jgi:hypothetical protein